LLGLVDALEKPAPTIARSIAYFNLGMPGESLRCLDPSLRSMLHLQKTEREGRVLRRAAMGPETLAGRTLP